MKKDERISGMLLLLFGGITVLLSLRMPLGTFRMAGTGLFPLFLGILLMILSGLFLLNSFYQETRVVKREETGKTQGSTRQLLLFFGTMLLATFCFNTFGYPLVSFLLMVSLLAILGLKRWGLNILISLVTAAGSYFLFVRWLNIPLPKGWIGL